ncbi:MAG: transglutaminase-like domain-containing protein [Blastocatellia bacterium]
MAITLQEYLGSFRKEQAKSLFYLYDELDSSGFQFMQAVLATLSYQGQPVNYTTITTTALDMVRKFYVKPPLEVNYQMDKVAQGLTHRFSHNVDKAKSLFDWIVKIIRYGKEERGPVGYRTSLETFWSQEGVCGEMAILFIALASLAGVPSAYVPVRGDLHGRVVNHACAGIYDETLRTTLLIDPAYHRFGVAHKNYLFIDHEQLNEKFITYANQE